MARPASSTVGTLAALVVLAFVSEARANPEPTATYDGRVVGMGGTAVAHIDNAPAIVHNPAGLGQIRRSTFTLASAVLMVRYNAPFAGPGSEQDSPPLIAPVPFIGGGARLSDRLTLGGAFYITTGFGGTFRDIRRIDDYTPRTPCPNAPIGTSCTPGGETTSGVVTQSTDEQVIRLFVAEVAATLAYEITDDVRVGVSLRLPWAQQSALAMQEVRAGQWGTVDQSVRGFGLPSVTLGTQWDVSEDFSIGLMYRARASARMKGSNQLRILGDADEIVSINASTEWVTPHMFRVGATGRLVDGRLVLSGEFRAQFHRSVNQRQSFDLTNEDLQAVLDGSGLNPFVAPFEWQNVYYPTLGMEYQVADHWWVRIGGSAGITATPPRTASPFAPPPGISYAYTLGVGGEFGRWRVDLGYQQAINGPYTVRQRDAINCRNDAQQKSGCDGTYQIDAYTFGLSLGFNN